VFVVGVPLTAEMTYQVEPETSDGHDAVHMSPGTIPMTETTPPVGSVSTVCAVVEGAERRFAEHCAA
jgi:hypothetical protein